MNMRATSRQARRQADLLSVTALAEVLRKVVHEPADFIRDDKLQLALRSQGSLAKLTIPGTPVRGMSLNHQRIIAESVLGSYDALDALRKMARDAVASSKVQASSGGARSKSGLLARNKALELQVALLKQDLALLQRAYDLRCIQARTYAAAASQSIQTLCLKEQQEIDASFSLRKRPREQATVVDLEDARNRGKTDA